MRANAFFALALVLGWVGDAQAQYLDRRGEVSLDVPRYQGRTANAPIPTSMHARNEGGSDGQGLCVIASLRINGRYQGVPRLEQLWQIAKRRPGGYSPSKLANLVELVMPDERWASYVGTDTSVLERLSAQGYPIGSTMNTGAQYGYRPIHHMISLIHYQRNGLACVVDNNDPGKYHWMPASEYDRRWIDGGTGWAWIWTRRPSAAQVGSGFAALILALAAAVLVAGSRRRQLGAS